MIFLGFRTFVDLNIIDMKKFETILEMNWLSPYRAILGCYAKSVTVALPIMES